MRHFRTELLLTLSTVLLLSACGGSNDGSPTPTPTPMPPANAAPVFSSPGTAAAPENSTATFYTAAATDPEGASIAYSIAGGADAAQFQITASGALAFISPPSFSAPTDADTNNVYLVNVSASDGVATTQLPLQVTVADRVGTSLQLRVQSRGYTSPMQVISLPNLRGGSNYVVQRTGQLVLQQENGTIVTALDISSSISSDGERGFLGAALGRGPATSVTNGGIGSTDYIYVFVTTIGGDLEVRRYSTSNYRTPFDPTSAKLIIRIPHASSNTNNGGWLEFGSDGFLYVGTGDGGGTGDPANTAQNPASLLGKILRLDVTGDAFPQDPNRNYAIPAGNPFDGTSGAQEVWAVGLRNPTSGSFTPYGFGVNVNKYAYVADRGLAREEVNIVSPTNAGLNYGWPYFDGTTVNRTYAGSATLTPPATEYAHGAGVREGSAIAVGPVYSGARGDLRGQLLFADRSTGAVWSLPETSLLLGRTVTSTNFILRTKALAPPAGNLGPVVSFYQIYETNVKVLDANGVLFDLIS
jgi:glucose/arabinose dehydrogenase